MEIAGHCVEGTDLFVHRLGHFYRSGIFSDLTIRTQDQDLKVHRMIVCSRSDVFCKIFDTHFDQLENIPNVVIDLTAENPRALQAMLRSFYGLQYDEFNITHDLMCPMLFNVEVYAIAHTFGVEYLQIQSKLKFIDLIRGGSMTSEFAIAVRAAYSSTPDSDRGLRDVIVAVCQERKAQLSVVPSFVQLLADVPSLASDIASLSGLWLPGHVSSGEALIVDFYNCLSCRAKWQIKWTDAVTFTECPFCGDNKIIPY